MFSSEAVSLNSASPPMIILKNSSPFLYSDGKMGQILNKEGKNCADCICDKITDSDGSLKI